MSERLPSLRIGRLEAESIIVLGGMSQGLTGAWISAEVANNGGFGTIGGVGLGLGDLTKSSTLYLASNEIALRKEIIEGLERSNGGNVGVNLMVAATDYENSVKVAVEAGARFIASGAGLPTSLPEFVDKYSVHGQDTPELIPIVSSVRALKIILKRWQQYGDKYKGGELILPAAIALETPNDAGGHLGVTDVNDIGTEAYSLETVIPQLVDYLEANNLENIPIIAAGGIWDKADANRMLSLGARGVQMATRFLATDECGGTKEFKDYHMNTTDKIEIIHSPVGLPGRAYLNDFLRRTNENERINLGSCVKCLSHCEHQFDRDVGYCIIRALDNVHHGKVDSGILFVGTNGYRIKEQPVVNRSTKLIMQELTAA